MSEPSSPDIVAFLDRWLAANYDETSYSDIKPVTVRRARDEIVALRGMVEKQRFVLSKGHAEVRAEALEQAARVADGYVTDRTDDVAKGIRALKSLR